MDIIHKILRGTGGNDRRKVCDSCTNSKRGCSMEYPCNECSTRGKPCTYGGGPPQFYIEEQKRLRAEQEIHNFSLVTETDIQRLGLDFLFHTTIPNKVLDVPTNLFPWRIISLVDTSNRPVLHSVRPRDFRRLLFNDEKEGNWPFRSTRLQDFVKEWKSALFLIHSMNSSLAFQHYTKPSASEERVSVHRDVQHALDCVKHQLRKGWEPVETVSMEDLKEKDEEFQNIELYDFPRRDINENSEKIESALSPYNQTAWCMVYKIVGLKKYKEYIEDYTSSAMEYLSDLDNSRKKPIDSSKLEDFLAEWKLHMPSLHMEPLTPTPVDITTLLQTHPPTTSSTLKSSTLSPQVPNKNAADSREYPLPDPQSVMGEVLLEQFSRLGLLLPYLAHPSLSDIRQAAHDIANSNGRSRTAGSGSVGLQRSGAKADKDSDAAQLSDLARLQQTFQTQPLPTTPISLPLPTLQARKFLFLNQKKFNTNIVKEERTWSEDTAGNEEVLPQFDKLFDFSAHSSLFSELGLEKFIAANIDVDTLQPIDSNDILAPLLESLQISNSKQTTTWRCKEEEKYTGSDKHDRPDRAETMAIDTVPSTAYAATTTTVPTLTKAEALPETANAHPSATTVTLERVNAAASSPTDSEAEPEHENLAHDNEQYRNFLQQFTVPGIAYSQEEEEMLERAWELLKKEQEKRHTVGKSVPPFFSASTEDEKSSMDKKQLDSVGESQPQQQGCSPASGLRKQLPTTICDFRIPIPMSLTSIPLLVPSSNLKCLFKNESDDKAQRMKEDESAKAEESDCTVPSLANFLQSLLHTHSISPLGSQSEGDGDEEFYYINFTALKRLHHYHSYDHESIARLENLPRYNTPLDPNTRQPTNSPTTSTPMPSASFLTNTPQNTLSSSPSAAPKAVYYYPRWKYYKKVSYLRMYQRPYLSHNDPAHFLHVPPRATQEELEEEHHLQLALASAAPRAKARRQRGNKSSRGAGSRGRGSARGATGGGGRSNRGPRMGDAVYSANIPGGSSGSGEYRDTLVHSYRGGLRNRRRNKYVDDDDDEECDYSESAEDCSAFETIIEPSQYASSYYTGVHPASEADASNPTEMNGAASNEEIAPDMKTEDTSRRPKRATKSKVDFSAIELEEDGDEEYETEDSGMAKSIRNVGRKRKPNSKYETLQADLLATRIRLENLPKPLPMNGSSKNCLDQEGLGDGLLSLVQASGKLENTILPRPHAPSPSLPITQSGTVIPQATKKPRTSSLLPITESGTVLPKTSVDSIGAFSLSMQGSNSLFTAPSSITASASTTCSSSGRSSDSMTSNGSQLSLANGQPNLKPRPIIRFPSADGFSPMAAQGATSVLEKAPPSVITQSNASSSPPSTGTIDYNTLVSSSIVPAPVTSVPAAHPPVLYSGLPVSTVPPNSQYFQYFPNLVECSMYHDVMSTPSAQNTTASMPPMTYAFVYPQPMAPQPFFFTTMSPYPMHHSLPIPITHNVQAQPSVPGDPTVDGHGARHIGQ